MRRIAIALGLVGICSLFTIIYVVAGVLILQPRYGWEAAKALIDEALEFYHTEKI